MKKILSFLSLLFTVYAQSNLEAISCPFPEGPSIESEIECRKYSACSWTNERCHMQDNSIAGYVIVSEPETTGRGFKVKVKKYDPTITMFDEDIPYLTFEVIHHEDYHVQIKIYDPSNVRYEVPIPLYTPDEAGTSSLYSVTVSNVGSPFTFSVVRNSNAHTIFESIGPITFENQFIQFTTSLPSSYVYGFGETAHISFRHNFNARRTTPLFSRDQPVGYDTELNEYGVHPYYVNIEDDEGNTHSVLFYNSNAMEYSTFSLDDGTPAITLRTIGGIIDLHFFLGPTPERVNEQYAVAIGTPVFPPYWALGFQLSRYGYESLDNLKAVRQRMKDAGIPQDVQTCDIDYMYHNRDFTYDHENWEGFPEFINELHDDGVKLMLILDPALAIDYSPSANGRDRDVFIKWMDKSLIPEDQEPGTRDYIVGYLWPDNKTVFPDFLKPETRKWWSSECQTLHETLPFDALWIDMNEPSNFGTNLDRAFNYPADLPNWSLKCPFNVYDSPPFPTKATYERANECKRLSDKTICMSGLQSDGVNSYLHYDVHSIYGHSESLATYQAMEDIFPGKRHFILSRSTYPGSGRFAAHWLGDNAASWEQMRLSIIGMLEFNLFIIPNVGADICGFAGEPSEELCARWMQLGAFYPYSRNHNTIGTPDQDPARPDWPIVNSVSRDVLLLRYKYLPYLYTLFHKASKHGGSIVRPLFNVFPSDVAARDVDHQFLWGDSLLVAPVVYQYEESRDVYFPKGLWYDLVEGTLAATGSVTSSIDAPIEKIPVYIRGGTILPYQEPDVTTTLSFDAHWHPLRVDSFFCIHPRRMPVGIETVVEINCLLDRLNPFGLTIALDESGVASGDIYWDDGESVHSMSESYMAFIDFSDNKLKTSIKHGEDVVAGLSYGTIEFYGYPSNPSCIEINGKAQDNSVWTFNSTTRVLSLSVIAPLAEELLIQLS